MKVPSRKQAEAFFCELDVNNDGVVSPSELRQLLQERGYSNEDIAAMFSDVDRDQDKKITKEELLEEVLKKARECTIDEVFQECDCDADGNLNHDEALRAGQNAGLDDHEIFEKCWAELDRDGSGYVSLEEFRAYFKVNY